MRIEYVTAFLYALKPRGIRFGLESTKQVLKSLGMPQNRFRSVHLAGSNGKGSTSAFLDAILRQAGIKVGLYTSPHLVHYRERFRINGEPVEDVLIENTVDRLLKDGLDMDPEEVQGWIEDGDMIAKMSSNNWYNHRGGASIFCSLTFFECTTILAMMLFEQAGIDVAIMECGMGGRLDATNVLMPEVSVITPIHLEHTQWLGDTICAIAKEKAGIIKSGVPVVCGRQNKDAMEVIRHEAARLQAPLCVMGEDFDGFGGSREASFRIHQLEIGPVPLGLFGRHQVDNAATALACLPILREFGYVVAESSIIEGLTRVSWPGRFERFGERGEWILDGAHNPDGVRVLVNAIQEVMADQKVRLVFGVLEDKKVEEMLPLLIPLASQVYLVRPKDARGKNPEELLSFLSTPPHVFSSVNSAIETLASEDGPPILITGSLAVVGESRDWLLKRFGRLRTPDPDL